MRSAATALLPADDGAPDPIRVCLLSAGTHGISGGHRYHQHLLTAAPGAGFAMWVARPGIQWRLPPADVVVIDSLYAWTTALALRRRHRPIAVAIVHQHPGGTGASGRARSLRHRLDLATYRQCDLVVTPGPIIADVLAAKHGLDPTRIEVIEPGCDLPPAKHLPALRAGRRLGLLNVANWLPNKGILELLDAVAALPPQYVTLHLAGRTDVAPKYSSAVQRRIERPDLVDRTIVHGALGASAVASLYAAADAFAFPSRLETYGSAVGEALAAGVPVIGWRTPHLCGLVDDEVEGLLVAPGRTDELTAAIHRLAIDHTERRRLADGARRRGARLPTWPQTTSRFFNALSRLVAKPVEPPHNPVAPVDIDATDTGVLDI
jgi:glycosyltransferase involved in cell wall biosynthesis